MTRIIPALSEISARYDALFVDLWGCVHDGLKAIPSAVDALRRYRSGGGCVILLTNAPRSRHEVARQLARFGVPEDAWDDIATSGDSARVAMFRGAVGNKVWFMGRTTTCPSSSRSGCWRTPNASNASSWSKPRASSAAGLSIRKPTRR